MIRQPRRGPVNIDDDDAIDFSSVSATAKPSVPAALRHPAPSAAPHSPTEWVAMDPRLQSYAQRPAPRRRLGFGASPPVGSVPNETPSSSAAQLAAFWREDAAQQEAANWATRRATYAAQLHAFWAPERAAPMRHHTPSFFAQFFADGVPDVEPWDAWALALPRYGAPLAAAAKTSAGEGLLDRVYHPVLPETHYARHYMSRKEDKPVSVKVLPTREELRAQRRERLRKEKEARERAKRAAAELERQKQTLPPASTAVDAGAVTLQTTTRDRLTNANLRFNLFSNSVLNPMLTENKVLSQYQERFLAHQRRNHDRHVAALPNQLEKRQRDLKRHAEENPVLRAYRIYPIYTPAHLGKLRHFANDGLLRGFVLWVGHCDALLVLSGGEAAVRHLERWVLEKMRWESSETRAVRLFSCPLPDAATFSFVARNARKRQRQNAKDGKDDAAQTEKDEHQHVYMNFVETVEEGEQFMRSMPTEGPWKDMTHVWRAAFAADAVTLPK